MNAADVENNLKKKLPTVIVLAGGQGTRLKSEIGTVPKILAPIGGKSFLSILMMWLKEQEAVRVIFSLGYQAEQVISALSMLPEKSTIDISFFVEDFPLGTLGGLSLVLNNEEINECIVINGDTIADVNLTSFVSQHRKLGSDSAIIVTQVEDASRYGSVTFLNENIIDGFKEKVLSNVQMPWVNTGIYYFSSSSIDIIKSLSYGSIEHDYFSRADVKLGYSKFDCNIFIDIGTPSSFYNSVKILGCYL